MFKKNQTDKKKRRLSALMLLLVTGVLFYATFRSENPAVVWQTIIHADLKWLFLAMLCYVGFWFFESVAINLLVKRLAEPNYKLVESIKTALIGILFSCLTPSSSGGQPMQVLRMKKQGVSVGRSTAIFVLRFVALQLATVVLCVVLILWRYDYFVQNVTGFNLMLSVGVVVNLAAGLFLLLISLLPKMAHKSAGFVINFLAKLRLIKHKIIMQQKAKKLIAEFSEWPRLVRDDKSILVKQFLLTFLQMLCYYLVAFCAFRAISPERVDLGLTVAASACVWLISSFVPLPGGSGGAEAAFLLLFGAIYHSSGISSGLLLWRFATFYLPIIAGMLFLFVENRRRLKMNFCQRLFKKDNS